MMPVRVFITIITSVLLLTYIPRIDGEWEQVITSGTAPSPRGSGLVVIDSNQNIYVWAGDNGPLMRHVERDLFKISTKTGTWEALHPKGLLELLLILLF